MSQEHSAEWLRGAVFMAECLGDERTEEQYKHLLAAAEAREAIDRCPTCGSRERPRPWSQYTGEAERCINGWHDAEAREAGKPNVCDLAAAEELDMLAAHIQNYIGPDDARDDIRRICYNRAKDLRRNAIKPRESTQPTQPTAAEVIAGAKKALEDCRANVANHPDGHQKQFLKSEEMAEKSLLEIAAWEAAQR